jgi:diguanylate cyclase (GGDEF)-like protein/PAS domain S-box-containing protein
MKTLSAAALWGRRARSLTTLLSLGFGAVIALSLVLGVTSFVSGERSVGLVDNLLKRDKRVAELTLRSSQAMLKARRAESDFLILVGEIGPDAARERYALLVHSNLEDLREYLTSIRILRTDQGVAEKISQIELKTQQYEVGFLALVDLYLKLGNADSGLEGQLRETANKIEALINASGHRDLLVNLLTLRGYEKDFIGRAQDRALKQFQGEVKGLRAKLNRGRLSTAEKAHAEALLVEYSRLFMSYALIVGAAATAKSEYVAVAHEIAPLLEDLHTDADIRSIDVRDEVQSAASVMKWTTIVTLAIAALLVALIAWIVSRRITGAVAQLIVFAKQVAAGDYRTRTSTRGEKEFAILGAALNGMAESLEQSHASLEQRAVQLAQSNAALQDEVTERKLVEQKLRLKNRAIESSTNAVVLTDNSVPWNPIEYVNPAFERMTGYTLEEVVGTNSRFLLGQSQDQPGVEIIREAVRENREAHTALHYHRKDGSLFWVDLYIAPVLDDAGTPTHFVGILNDITEAKRFEEQLQKQANHDALTQLPNRTLLLDRIAQAIAVARRQNSRAMIAFLDLDRFKLINDSFGHDVGDDLLREVAARLLDCVRTTDTVALLGADVFVIVLTDELTDEISLPVINRIVERIAQPVSLRGTEHVVTCSIGISVFPQDGTNAETLLKNADRAMYQAKQVGRNSFQFFTAEMNEQLDERLKMEAGLRQAITGEELELHYQPQVDLSSGEIIGFEALVRWNHPKHGTIAPARFIPIAEESDLILALGEWVLRRACSQNQAWITAGLPALPVAVNVSARQFQRQDIPSLVRGVLQETGLAPRLLELELTESVSMREPQKTIELIERLTAMGVKVAIDDFGTGYSNLTYLKKFPVAKLKLDRSFVVDITNNPESLAIARAIIEMGHSLRLKVIAEGVETESQLALLKAHGCDQFQGYLFSKPLRAKDFADLLRSRRRLTVGMAGKEKTERTALLDDEPYVLSLARSLASGPCRVLQAGSSDNDVHNKSRSASQGEGKRHPQPESSAPGASSPGVVSRTAAETE